MRWAMMISGGISQAGALLGFFGLLGISLAASPATDRSESAPAVKDLVLGLIARSQAVFSGRLAYTTRDGVRGIPDRDDSEENVKLSFSGTSWVERVPGWRVAINHRGKYVELTEHPQRDRTVGYLLGITTEQSMHDGHSFPGRRPSYAGTFWQECTRNYVGGKPSEAVYKGVKGLKGVKTHILEWRVPKAEATNAFRGLTQATMGGGILRLYVAPQLGYVLPRIEHEGTTGVVDQVFESTGFVQVPSGLYFPMRCSHQTYDDDGTPGFFVDHEISTIEKINEEIPEEDFRVEVPIGTKVRDYRPGRPNLEFRVGSAQAPSPKELEDLLILPAVPRPSGYPWITAMLVGGVAGLALLIAYLKFGRRRGG